ncbi:unnamed protein product, partial [Scytosiphon promiscuus]
MSENHTPRRDTRPASSPLRSYAKGKNSLWLLNSDSYSSVTMKMLIEKQAAAAAAATRLNSPSRLETFAADSPPRRRRPRTPTKMSGSSRGDRDTISSPPAPHRTASSGGIALTDLISATTPPRKRSSAIKVDTDREMEQRRSLAQDTYTKTFTGMQAYGESGMTVLEELIDAAFRACDVGHAQGRQRVTGAALLTRSGKIFAGCNVESSSADLSVGAERTTVLKAVSEGETRFRSMAMASDTDLGFPSPDGPGRQFLAEFGEFPVYLVNRDMQVKIASTGELYPMMPPGPAGGERTGLGPGGARDEAIVAASREREKRPPRDWGVQEVLDWLEDELELGEYRREFARAKVDGSLLLNLKDKDLHDLLGMGHPLHRRRVCLGVQKIKDREEEEMGKNYADMDDYVRHLDRDRVRLVTKLKVVFDRFDNGGTGSISAADARDALEYMGRDVTGEACASWLADKQRTSSDSGGNDSGISFVDFTTAYSALFVDEDPDIDLGQGRHIAGARNRQGVSITGSGHVRLRQKQAAHGRTGGSGGSSGGGETHDRLRGLWEPGGCDEEEGFQARGGKPSSPRKVPPRAGHTDYDDDTDLDDDQAEAFEALRSVKKLAEVKRVFDRFAVDGMLTAYEALQALTEAGCSAPRTHAGRYLRSRRFFGLRREVTFFEFLRSMAALGVQDSRAHVAGFAPSMLSRSGGGSSTTPLSTRNSNRRRRYYDSSCHDDDIIDEDDEGGGQRGSSGGSRRRKLRPGGSRGGTDYEDNENCSEEGEQGFTAMESDEYSDDLRRERSARRGTSPSRSTGVGKDARGRTPPPRGRSIYGERTRSSSRSPNRRPYGGGQTYGGRSTTSDESTGDDGSSNENAFGGRRNSRHGGRSSRDRQRRSGSERGRERFPDRGRGTVNDDADSGEQRHSRNARYDEYGGDGKADRRSGGSAWGRLKANSPRAGGAHEARRDQETRGESGGGFIAKGDKVEARYRGKGTKFYKGKISRVNSDDTFDIAYDDGEKEIAIAAEHVRSLEPQSSAGNDRDRGRGKAAALLEGDRVEADFRGRGRYYPGRIARVNLDGTFNIDYDDGEKERGVTDDLVRANNRRGGRSDERRIGSVTSMQKGDKVEARYRGKGTKFYKGKISRVNSDDTFDIAYDDGEKEIAIA